MDSIEQTTGISLPPGTILGIVGGRPVYNIAGGADDDGSGMDIDDGSTDDSGYSSDDDTDDSSDTDPGDDSAADDTEPAPKPKPPAAKKDEPEFKPPTEAEWRKTQQALKKANEDGKRHRLRNKELEEKQRENESESERAIREAREEGEKRYRAPLVKAAARAALAEAGVNGSAERVLRLVDTDGLSVDDDGDVIGLDAEIDRVKQEYPEFFQTAKPKPKARPTAAGREPAPEKPKSSAEMHAMKVLRRAG
ncbi:phage scaffolding protein [Streptomyces sp. NPDC006784]|uniref:phage scaffolding protein n=1 Tax=Streptomyces sp. NPDC006784 TaxID=3364764 RepID=UPI0036858649